MKVSGSKRKMKNTHRCMLDKASEKLLNVGLQEARSLKMKKTNQSVTFELGRRKGVLQAFAVTAAARRPPPRR